MIYREFAVLWKVQHRLAEMTANCNTANAKAVIGDDLDEDSLAQRATDYAVEGQYLSALMCEAAAQLAREEGKGAT